MPLHAGSSGSSAGVGSVTGSRLAPSTQSLPHPDCHRSSAQHAAACWWLAGLPSRVRSATSRSRRQQTARQPCRQGQQRARRISCSVQSSKSQAAALTQDAASRADERERRKAASARNHRITMVRVLGKQPYCFQPPISTCLAAALILRPTALRRRGDSLHGDSGFGITANSSVRKSSAPCTVASCASACLIWGVDICQRRLIPSQTPP